MNPPEEPVGAPAEEAVPAEDVVVPAALDGQRLDRAVSLLAGVSRAEAAELVAGGHVRIGGRPVTTKTRRLREGESFSVDATVLADQVVALVPDPTVPLDIVYADEDLVVVDKPAGMVVHPGAGHKRGTLVQGLLARYPDLARLADAGPSGRERGTGPSGRERGTGPSGRERGTGPSGRERGSRGEERPGIVQRLDVGTSGLLVVARSERAYESLVDQLQARTVERSYTVLVAGAVEGDEGVVDAPIGRSSGDPTKQAVMADGRPARTRYKVVRRFEEPFAATLLDCRLETGRTHQIRVHLAAIGHPVVGDPRYGGPSSGSSPRPDESERERPLLHARVLGFVHPDGRSLRFESELPADLSDALGRFSPSATRYGTLQ